MKTDRAESCIYCGSKSANRTSEHILAHSLGGRLEIPAASCSECARITSKVETHVAGKTYLQWRAAKRLRTRRQAAYPTQSSVILEYKDGRKKHLKLKVSDGLYIIIVPRFNLQFTYNNILHSRCTANAKFIPDLPDSRKIMENIIMENGARSLCIESGQMDSAKFAQVIWKTACGLYYLSDPKSLYASSATENALGKGTIFIGGTSEENPQVFLDIYSSDISNGLRGSSGRVYSLESEDHRNLWCEVRMLTEMPFPAHTVRIDNIGRQPMDRLFPC